MNYECDECKRFSPEDGCITVRKDNSLYGIVTKVICLVCYEKNKRKDEPNIELDR